MLADGFIESFERRYPRSILETLLCDRTTGRNIIWADGEYEQLGDGYAAEDEITCEAISGTNSGVIKPRVLKAQERQSKRTKARAEVFTPSWLVNEMANALDEDWFRRKGTFTEGRADSWEPNAKKVEFPSAKGHGWHDYVRSTRLEITCGEAPFLCSRYDTVTGEALPVSRRIGVLDRKLRVVGERLQTYRSWAKWALSALRATYGYEYQGDNLLIARVNCLETFVEHCIDRWGAPPRPEDVRDAAWVISWNLWQMNGLTCAVPTTRLDAPVQSTLGGYVAPEQEPQQPTLFDYWDELSGEVEESETEDEGTSAPADGTPLCVIYDWENDQPVEFSSMKGEVSRGMKKFYAVIGNPPYQEESQDTSDKPIYDKFMDAAFDVAERIELITPGRFLFNAGKTPKAWNQKMLDDPHFKVLKYESDASSVFPNTEIKGGVAVSYRDSTMYCGAMHHFIPDPIMRDIQAKVNRLSRHSLDILVNATEYFKISSVLYDEHPELLSETLVVKGKEVPLISKGHESDLTSNILDKNTKIFTDTKPDDDQQYVRVFGRKGGQRTYCYVKSKYLQPCEGLTKYKVIVPESNNAGKFGETLVDPIVGGPDVATTQTFITIGFFDSQQEANHCLAYICTKFARATLSTLKITQHNKRPAWANVPLQDFTSSSDIDWSQPVADIDQQLYRKYGLSQDEVDFIESHVKEMK